MYTLAANVPSDYDGHCTYFAARTDEDAARIVCELLLTSAVNRMDVCNKYGTGTHAIDALTVSYAQKHGFTVYDAAYRTVDVFAYAYGAIPASSLCGCLLSGMDENTAIALDAAILSYEGSMIAANTTTGEDVFSQERRAEYAAHATAHALRALALLTGIAGK